MKSDHALKEMFDSVTLIEFYKYLFPDLKRIVAKCDRLRLSHLSSFAGWCANYTHVIFGKPFLFTVCFYLHIAMMQFSQHLK